MSYLQGNFEERCRTTGAPTEISVFSATFTIILIIFNIPGNLLLIQAVAIDPYKNLRNPFNYLMMNLAVADLLAGIVTAPLYISYSIKEGSNKRILTAEYRTLHMFYFISSTASVLSLASLSVERYYAICHPHTYRCKVTGKRLLGTLIGIWFIALTLPFVYLEVDFITCAFIMLNTTVFVAVAITCFTYGFMIYKFKGRRKSGVDTKTKNENTRAEGHVDSTIKDDRQDPREVTSQHGQTAVQDKAVIWEQMITKRFLVVMVALLGCYVPATILIYVTSLCASCSCAVLHWLRDLQKLFILMNSSVNFFCYGLRSSRFRRAFARILRVRSN